jgi:hypothetical protein
MFVNRNLKHSVRHAVGCFRLPKETRQLAKQHVATRAPSKLLENELAKADGLGVESGIVATKKRRIAVDETPTIWLPMRAKVYFENFDLPFEPNVLDLS